MKFEHIAKVTLDLVAPLQWLWHSTHLSRFIAGDERVAYGLPQADPSNADLLEAARPHDDNSRTHHPCNLPIPDLLYEEFADSGWHGFRFLPAVAYDNAIDANGHPVGDLLRTIVFGPDYGQYVLHPSSGLVLGLRAGTLELLRQSSDEFVRLDETRTRGRSAMTFAAHPEEFCIVYGDNFGTFHAHKFSEAGFGKAKKIAAKQRKAGTLDFIDEGRTLVIGGMGYLATLSLARNKILPLHEISCSVREIQWNAERRILFVNQGVNGLTCYHYDETGFTQIGAIKPDIAVRQMAVSNCLQYVAVSGQHSTEINVYAISGV